MTTSVRTPHIPTPLLILLVRKQPFIENKKKMWIVKHLQNEQKMTSSSLGLSAYIDSVFQCRVQYQENGPITTEIIPFELKTGNMSIGHYQQTLLYSLLLWKEPHHNLTVPPMGILHYLKEGSRFV